MALEDSVLFREVRAIASEGEKPVSHRWECQLFADETEVAILYVNSVEINRDYVNHFSEEMRLELTMGMGTYEKVVYPAKDKLEVLLRKIPLRETKRDVDIDKEIKAYRYRATLSEPKSGMLEGNNPVANSQTKGDNLVPKTLTLELYNPAIEKLRMAVMGGVFRDSKPADVVRYVLGKYSKQFNVDDAVSIRGVDVAPNSNPQVRDHYITPHGIRVVDFPRYVHEHCGGIYSGGFGYFMQAGIWYLFPPFDITGYEQSKLSLTVVNIPANRLPQPERSYRITDRQVIMVATGEAKQVDRSEEMQLNLGNGVRFIDANKVMEGFVSVDGNRATADRSQNTSEFAVELRANGVNNVQNSINRITSNYMVEYGRLAARQGTMLQIVWENADESLIYPGMPVKFMYLEGDKAQELWGRVIGSQTYSQKNTQGPTEQRFVSMCTLTLFLNKKMEFVDNEA